MSSLDGILVGQTTTHLVEFAPGIFVHNAAASPLTQLIKAAQASGFELKIASGFRAFEAQLGIWNAKCDGKRPVLDEKGNPLEIKKLDAKTLVTHILRWSALPGASRHHWGTDLDVFDSRALREGEKIGLVPGEAAKGGGQEKFHHWMTKNLGAHEFFRPYAKDLGGVSPEWWHVSYAPVANPYFESLAVENVEKALQQADLRHKDFVLENLPALFKKYVQNISKA